MWIPLFLRSSKHPSFMSLPGSYLPYSPGKVARNPVSKVLGQFSKRLYWLHEVNFNTLKLSGHIWVYKLSNLVFQPKSWNNNQCFKLCSVIKRTGFYWTYANTYIAMKIRIFTKSFQILEEWSRENKMNLSILPTKLPPYQIALSHS